MDAQKEPIFRLLRHLLLFLEGKMGSINLTDQEIESISAITPDRLRTAIDRAINEERPYLVRELIPANCGVCIDVHARNFEASLSNLCKAKSTKKKDQMRAAAIRDGWRLSDAVSSMQHRVSEELKQRERFYVYDSIPSPFAASDQMSVLVRFRWRNDLAEAWQYGTIDFLYSHKEAFFLSGLRTANRKPSAKERRDREDRLYRIWDQLKLSALCSVRDYFIGGGDGACIPVKFQVVTDERGGLNNYSTQFYRSR